MWIVIRLFITISSIYETKDSVLTWMQYLSLLLKHINSFFQIYECINPEQFVICVLWYNTCNFVLSIVEFGNMLDIELYFMYCIICFSILRCLAGRQIRSSMITFIIVEVLFSWAVWWERKIIAAWKSDVWGRMCSYLLQCESSAHHNQCWNHSGIWDLLSIWAQPEYHMIAEQHRPVRNQNITSAYTFLLSVKFSWLIII